MENKPFIFFSKEPDAGRSLPGGRWSRVAGGSWIHRLLVGGSKALPGRRSLVGCGFDSVWCLSWKENFYICLVGGTYVWRNVEVLCVSVFLVGFWSNILAVMEEWGVEIWKYLEEARAQVSSSAACCPFNSFQKNGQRLCQKWTVAKVLR